MADQRDEMDAWQEDYFSLVGAQEMVASMRFRWSLFITQCMPFLIFGSSKVLRTIKGGGEGHLDIEDVGWHASTSSEFKNLLDTA